MSRATIEPMDSRLLFQDAAGFATSLLAVFAVDIATDKDAEPLPALMTTSDAINDAAAKILGTGEFKAALG
jgi:leucyl aminopeptidase